VIGTTRHELRLWADPRARDIGDEQLADLLGRLGGPGADPTRMIGVYRNGPPPRTGAEIWEAARIDAVLRVPALRVADAHAAQGDAAFVYRFDWESPGLGAAHATDLPFTFGTFEADAWGAAVGADDRAEALGRVLRGAWCSFARTGDPSHAALGHWPRHDPRTRPTMCFAAESRVVLDPDGAARACWMGEPA
jgi:carboxylesterase type B